MYAMKIRTYTESGKDVIGPGPVRRVAEREARPAGGHGGDRVIERRGSGDAGYRAGGVAPRR
jgi:hypothetical protein